MDLNNPDIRQSLLRERLCAGTALVAAELADEFGISIDTVRRDLIALEAEGAIRRVRGGALPVRTPAAPLAERRAATPVPPSLVTATLQELGGARTLLLDGGTTVMAIARAMTPAAGLLVITPSPWIAVAAAERGIEVVTLGGQISARGGIAIGTDVTAALAGTAAEIALLGACGLDAEFGLSSDDVLESAVKRAMAQAARKVLVVTGAAKIGLRARHRTLAPDEIDGIVTDAPPVAAAALRDKGIEVRHG
ncbi:MAG: DeoR/GlpR transcriptional regulator [Rhodobacteraceae bacterium]|nr:DeoR/GlpR transcriptional regulator [Paracoccaceae bacterium]